MTEWIIEITPQAIEEAGESVEDLLSTFRNAGYNLFCISNNYSDELYLRPLTPTPLVKLMGTPTHQIDVIASKRRLGVKLRKQLKAVLTRPAHLNEIPNFQK